MNLLLCSKCARHVRDGSTCCPFCGATEVKSPPTMLRRASRSALLGVVVATAACHATSARSEGGTQTVPTTVYGGPPPFETTPIPPAPRLDGGVD